MDALMLLSAEFVVLGIAIWVVIWDSRSPEEVNRMLDAPPHPVAKKRFGNLAILRPASARPFRRPGAPPV